MGEGGGVELRVFTEPQQGATYDDQLRVARAAEDLGFDGFFRSDHYLSMSRPGPPGPTDAWVTLAGLARETSRIRLGTLVSPVTFRLPGPLAIQVAQVDAMSDGRVELGLGTGWFADEHTAYGIPFPDKRFGMLTEQLEVVTGLWRTPVGEHFSYRGDHYVLAEAPALPKPVQQAAVGGGAGVPIIVGGHGPRRTPLLAARFAAESNVFASAQEAPTYVARVREACETLGRDPRDIVMSLAMTTCVGSDEAEVRRRAAVIGRDPDQLRSGSLAGTVSEVVDTLGAAGAAGVSRVYLQVLDLADLDHLDLIAREVAPRL
jgi:F420-dependent oxidoreductase-like protein